LKILVNHFPGSCGTRSGGDEKGGKRGFGAGLEDGISRTAKHRPEMRWCFEPVCESGQGCVQEVWIVVSATGGEHE
jgi:hypothetical protein